jgi:hypothetical protein
MTEHEDTPLRRAIVTAWALHKGYTVDSTQWWPECEGIEAWEWTGPNGEELGDAAGDWAEMPAMPDDLFSKLNTECRWSGV